VRRAEPRADVPAERPRGEPRARDARPGPATNGPASGPPRSAQRRPGRAERHAEQRGAPAPEPVRAAPADEQSLHLRQHPRRGARAAARAARAAPRPPRAVVGERHEEPRLAGRSARLSRGGAHARVQGPAAGASRSAAFVRRSRLAPRPRWLRCTPPTATSASRNRARWPDGCARAQAVARARSLAGPACGARPARNRRGRWSPPLPPSY